MLKELMQILAMFTLLALHVSNIAVFLYAWQSKSGSLILAAIAYSVLVIAISNRWIEKETHRFKEEMRQKELAEIKEMAEHEKAIRDLREGILNCD